MRAYNGTCCQYRTRSNEHGRNAGEFALLVKALPMVHKEFAALSVSLQGFQAEGFVLEILSNAKPVPEGVLDQVFIHVEVSHFAAA